MRKKFFPGIEKPKKMFYCIIFFFGNLIKIHEYILMEVE